MKRTSYPLFRPMTKKLVSVVALAAVGALPLLAENVYVMSYQSTSTSEWTPCPPSCFSSTSYSLFGSSAISTVNNPPPPVTARRSVYIYSQDGGWSVQPGDYTAFDPFNNYYTAPLQTNEVYKVYVTRGITHSPDIVASMTVDYGSLSDTNGVGMAAVPTDAFNQNTPINTWNFVGYLTNVVPNPIVTFSYVSGTVNNSGNRWYTDVVRFERLDPCVGVADPPVINGPLASGQNFVNVAGVVAGATNITVFGYGSEIGQTNYAAGFAAGQVAVATTELYLYETITATQTKNGCVSDPSASVPVGGGANPTVEVCLGLWQSTAFTGPVGASTTANLTNSYYLKASGLVSGYNTAPTGGAELNPNQCWQTVTFENGIDDGILPGSAAHFTNTDSYCAFEGLIFSISQTLLDNGPFDIYVDQIMNGDVVIEDFEGYTNGAVVTFTAPNQATTPVASATYLDEPNSATISQNNAASGTNSLRIRWQFKDYSNTRWAHLRANALLGKQNPQLDVSKPITIRYLVLPVGQSSDYLSLPTVPQSQTKSIGDSVTFNVVPDGTPTYSYQWMKNGTNISGATDSSYNIASVAAGDAGAYSVLVTDANCMLTSPSAILTLGVPTSPVSITGLAGTSLNYTGGTGAQFVLIKSGSLAIGRTNWTRVATNPGTSTPGSFTIPAVGTPPSPTFYSIQSE